MRWSPRQRAMLGAMGLRLWEAAPLSRRDPESDSAVPVAPAPSAGEGAIAQAAASIPDAESAHTIARRTISPPTAQARQGRVTEDLAALDALDVANMDWSALRDAVSSCRACVLCEGRTQTVFGTGNPHAHWMIVGEAPGVQEDLLGEPFVGKSGQLLDAMLGAIKLTRTQGPASQQVFIANTLKCRPPGNRNPLPAELARCEPFLVRQIELVRPRVILAMGRFAVQALLRSDEPIGRLRGRVHRYHDVPLVVTYHPAYLLRNPLDKARAWD
ncbi:MAG: uracil-DNA glycosylase, partial [Burkholderiales bacterium]